MFNKKTQIKKKSFDHKFIPPPKKTKPNKTILNKEYYTHVLYFSGYLTCYCNVIIK